MTKYTYTLIKPLENRLEIPLGFEVSWNDWENGYTGKVMHWFSEREVENNDHWMVNVTPIPIPKNTNAL